MRMNAGACSAVQDRAAIRPDTNDMPCFGRDIRTCFSESTSRPIRLVVYVVGGAWS